MQGIIAQPDKKPRPGFRSPCKDGWSPEAIAHIKALIEIQRLVNGIQKVGKHQKDSNEVETGTNGQGKGNRKCMDAH